MKLPYLRVTRGFHDAIAGEAKVTACYWSDGKSDPQPCIQISSDEDMEQIDFTLSGASELIRLLQEAVSVLEADGKAKAAR
jgi:hypothetical protein